MHCRSQYKRFFILITVLLSLCTSRAQDPALQDLEHFELSVIALDMPYLPDIYFEDYKVGPDGKLIADFKHIRIGVNTRSQAFQIPINGQVQLYKSEDEKGNDPAKMRPFMSVPAKPDEKLLLVFHRDPEGKPTYNFMDDSQDSHPANTVRFANFGQSRVAASVGDRPIMIEPSEVKLLGQPVYFDPQRFQFVFAVERKGEPAYKSPQKNLRFSSPNKRLLIIYSSFSENLSDDGSSSSVVVFKPRAYRLYDNVESL